MSVKTNVELFAEMDRGNIVMVPRVNEQVNNGSIDVRLGRFIWVLKRPEDLPPVIDSIDPVIDPLICHGRDAFDLVDLMAGDFVLACGRRVLAHTHEFIGSRHGSIPEMRAKSTTARWGLTACACAGWGDVGYFNRWAMEVSNLNPFPYGVKLTVGMLIAQIVFHDIGDVAKGSEYNAEGAGHYQNVSDIEELMRSWKPEDLLPKSMKKVDFTPACEADMR